MSKRPYRHTLLVFVDSMLGWLYDTPSEYKKLTAEDRELIDDVRRDNTHLISGQARFRIAAYNADRLCERLGKLYGYGLEMRRKVRAHSSDMMVDMCALQIARHKFNRPLDPIGYDLFAVQPYVDYVIKTYPDLTRHGRGVDVATFDKTCKSLLGELNMLENGVLGDPALLCKRLETRISPTSTYLLVSIAMKKLMSDGEWTLKHEVLTNEVRTLADKIVEEGMARS